MLGFNLESKAFKDVNLRRAIKLCINRSKVVEGVDVKREFIPETIIPFGLSGYTYAESDSDIEKAKDYLALVPMNKRPKISDMVVHLPKNPHKMALYAINEINKGLAEIGLPVLSIKEVESDYGKGKIGNYYKFLREKDFNLYMRGLIATIPSSLYIVKENILKNSPMNFSRINNDKIVNEIKALESGQRSESLVFNNISKVLSDDVPFIILGNLFYNPASKADRPLNVHAISPNYINLNESISR